MYINKVVRRLYEEPDYGYRLCVEAVDYYKFQIISPRPGPRGIQSLCSSSGGNIIVPGARAHYVVKSLMWLEAVEKSHRSTYRVSVSVPATVYFIATRNPSVNVYSDVRLPCCAAPAAAVVSVQVFHLKIMFVFHFKK